MPRPSVTILPQQFRSHQIPQRLPIGGNSINLTNSVELSARPILAPEVAAPAIQRIDKVISENQAIVETLDPLWPRRYMRQNSKDDHTVLTMEKAAAATNRRIHPNSQVTMSLVTSSPQPQPGMN